MGKILVFESLLNGGLKMARRKNMLDIDYDRMGLESERSDEREYREKKSYVRGHFRRRGD